MGTPSLDLANIPAHPAFKPYETLVDRLGRRGFPDLHALNRLTAGVQSPPMSLFGAAIHFVPPKRQTSALAYEQRALERGEVGCRDGNWHDVFNALAWLAFPRTKAVLNAVHCVDGTAAAGTRSERRDALTLLDESGIIVACSDQEFLRLWRAHEWRRAFWDRRESLGKTLRVAVIGHGLLEKLLTPFRAITAKALIVPLAPDVQADVQALDAAAASSIMAADKQFTPASLPALPVAALPGWDTEHLGAALFDDASVFRPLPSR